MANSIPVPSYPAGSHNFVKRLLPNDAEPTRRLANGDSSNTKHLDIAIVGAGVGGLATAVALKRAGFSVTIYESSPVLSEIGAGIQVPPNSARILHSWGLEDDLKQKSVKPQSLIWRRWENGRTIGLTHLNPQFQKWFGAPYYLIHRAHLHEVLHKRAEELGVPIKLNSGVAKYSLDDPSLVLRDGGVVRADLIVAADGLRSFARHTLLGDEYTAPTSNGTAAYRATLTVDQIRSNPRTAWIADSASLNLWVGHQTHAMTYFIAGSQIFNMVLTHPEPNDDPASWDQSTALADMKAVYAGWDPSLVELVNMVSSTQKWPIQSIEIPDTWSSSSGKLVLLGDAAHAMLPNMALGAAMAVEDAAVLAECLTAYPGKEALKSAIDMYEGLRIPRARKAQESSVLHGYTLHYPDGPLQQARDTAMRPDIDGEHYIDSPNQWSDPATQLYFYMHDVVAETWKELEHERTSRSSPEVIKHASRSRKCY